MIDLAKQLQHAFVSHGKTLALAESCTGGAVASAITKIPGASKFFLGSVVAYSNEWKKNFLGVEEETLLKKTAVSLETVHEMAGGLLDRTDADFVAAISGTLGPRDYSAFLAIGEKGKPTQAHHLSVPKDRIQAIDFLVTATFEALLRRLNLSPSNNV